MRNAQGAFPLQACWLNWVANPGLDSTPSFPLPEGRSILLVDDDAGVRDVIRAMLTRHDYHPIMAADGREALALFARLSNQIAVVLTDLSMPGIDGLTLIRAIRKIKPTVKIIIATGHAGDGRGDEVLALGVNASLKKPFTRQALLRAIKKLMPPRKPL